MNKRNSNSNTSSNANKKRKISCELTEQQQNALVSLNSIGHAPNVKAANSMDCRNTFKIC